jgi:hypothetical protein
MDRSEIKGRDASQSLPQQQKLRHSSGFNLLYEKPHAIQSKNNQAIHFRILLHGRTRKHKSRLPILLALRQIRVLRELGFFRMRKSVDREACWVWVWPVSIVHHNTVHDNTTSSLAPI